MHPEVRRRYIGRARALEGSLRRLVHEIMDELPDEAQSRLRHVNSKIDVLFAEVEELTELDGSPVAARNAELRELRRDYDEATTLLANLERRRRDISRRREDLSMEEQKLHARQLEAEIEAELGGGEEGE
jgi:chromosome segregation ATPase